MSVNFEYYKVFYYAALYLNFTRAAEALYVSQPTVTKEIQNLEKYLGCELFLRKGKKLELSEEGELLFQHVKKACNEIFVGEALLADLKGMNAGTVKLCTNHSGALTLIEKMGNKFVEEYPKISILSSVAYNNVSLNTLDLGAANIVFILQSSEETGDEVTINSQLDWRFKPELVRNYMDVPVVGKELFGLCESVKSLEDLKPYPLVIPERSCVNRYYVNLLRDGGTVMHDFVQTDMNARMALVAAGYGIGFFPPEFVEDRIEKGEMKVISIPEKLMTWDLYMVTCDGRTLSKAEQKFCDYVRKL